MLVGPSRKEVCVRRKGREKAGRTGPPIAPKRTASAFLAAERASSVRGEPVASIEAWDSLFSWKGLARRVCGEKCDGPRLVGVLGSRT